MLKEFDKLARKYNIYPLKNGKDADPDYPQITRSHYDVYVGARSWGEYPYCDGSQGKPYTMSIYIDEAGPAANGILASQKGWALYVLDGYPVYASVNGSKIVSSKALPEGSSVVTVKIDYTDKKTKATLLVDGEKVGSMTTGAKLLIAPKANALNIGRQWGLPVNEDYESPFLFSGKIFKASIDVER